MTTYNRFEDLPVWKIARELTKKIYKTTSVGLLSKDFGLRDQLRRASVSVMSNIAEGFEHETQAQFISYLGRAKGSAGEIRSQLYIVLDLNYISVTEFKILSRDVIACSKQLYGLINYLRAQPKSRRTKDS